MKDITNLCTGCRTCEQLCPTGSISMESDQEGFLIPLINQSTCIDCQLCVKRCPQNHLMESKVPSSVYAFRYKEEEELLNSASGGAFIAIAHHVIESGGIVYGAAYIDDDLHVAHVKVDNIENLSRLQSSKYVQSNTLQTYKDVKNNLLLGRTVLYSGTPCQIAGLKSFLKKEYETLLTVDVICHGVPSPLLFEKYIQWLSKKISKIVCYNFRDKSSGWGLGYKARAKARALTLPGELDPYYYHFLEGNTYRECCYQCKYAKKSRVSDLTIGDYWGIEKEHPNFYSIKGVSCVLVNSKNGRVAFDSIQKDSYILESTFEKVSNENGNLLHPTKRSALRDNIYKGINSKDVDAFFSENLKFKKDIKSIVKAYIPGRLKMMLKKVVKIICY